MMKKWMSVLLVIVLSVFLAIPASAASYKVTTPKWVTIDGKITQEEWGKPLYKNLTLQQAEAGKVDDQVTARWYDTSNNGDASADVYLTHNDAYIFIGCVVRNVDRETVTDSKPWQQMHFAFSLANYVKGTDVPHGMYQGQEYEHYTAYRVYLAADGMLGQQALAQGMTAKELYPNSDYVVVYDAKTRTMTYEVAVPFGYTKIKLSDSQDIVFSAVIAFNQSGNSANGSVHGPNAILIGTAAANRGGAYNWAHQGHCVYVKLASPKKVEESKPKVENATTTKPSTNKQDETVEVIGEPNYEEGNPASQSNLIVWISCGVTVLGVALIVAALFCGRKKKTGEGNEQ